MLHQVELPGTSGNVRRRKSVRCLTDVRRRWERNVLRWALRDTRHRWDNPFRHMRPMNAA